MSYNQSDSKLKTDILAIFIYSFAFAFGQGASK